MGVKMNEVCILPYSLDDPRVEWNSEACDNYNCKLEESLLGDGTYTLPRVCGNCIHYTVQGEELNDSSTMGS